MSIYTKSGDLGETSLLNGGRFSKSDQYFYVLGTLDELNAFLGLFYSSRKPEVKKVINEIQHDIFELGALVANPNSTEVELSTFAEKISRIEDSIDKFDSKLPKLQNFILPSGSVYSVYLHLSRAICRRLEREFLRFCETSEKYKIVLPYINRISDLLFVLARYVNFKLGIVDEIWKKR